MAAPDGSLLDRLYRALAARRGGDIQSSYTATLLSSGTERVAQKLGEEALEAARAATAGRRDGVIGESADLLYHLLVLWLATGVEPDEVWRELERREGTSGMLEKAQRPGG